MKLTTIVVVVALLGATTTAQAQCLRVFGECVTLSGDRRSYGTGSTYASGDGGNAVAIAEVAETGLLILRDIKIATEAGRTARHEMDVKTSGVLAAQAAATHAATTPTGATTGASAPASATPASPSARRAGEIYVKVTNKLAVPIEVLVGGKPTGVTIDPTENDVFAVVPGLKFKARWQELVAKSGVVEEKWHEEDVVPDPAHSAPVTGPLPDGSGDAPVWQYVVQP